MLTGNSLNFKNKKLSSFQDMKLWDSYWFDEDNCGQLVLIEILSNWLAESVLSVSTWLMSVNRMYQNVSVKVLLMDLICRVIGDFRSSFCRACLSLGIFRIKSVKYTQVTLSALTCPDLITTIRALHGACLQISVFRSIVLSSVLFVWI